MKTNNWKDTCLEVTRLGFANASPIGRLVYSCEIGQIDQHASDDLIAVMDALDRLAGLGMTMPCSHSAHYLYNGTCAVCVMDGDVEEIIHDRVIEIDQLRARVKQLEVEQKSARTYISLLELSIRAGEVVLECDECDGDGNRDEMDGNDPDSARVVKCPYCEDGSVEYKTSKR